MRTQDSKDDDTEQIYGYWLESDDYEWLQPYTDDNSINICMTESQVENLIEKLENIVGDSDT